MRPFFTRKFFVRLINRIFLCAISFILLFGILCLIFPIPDNIEYSTCVLDDHGQVVHAFLTHDQQWRMKLDASELTDLLKNTILSKEDKYFYFHPGVNPAGIMPGIGRKYPSWKNSIGSFHHYHAGGTGPGTQEADILQQNDGNIPRGTTGIEIFKEGNSGTLSQHGLLTGEIYRV